MTLNTAYSPDQDESCGVIVADDGVNCGFQFFAGKINIEDVQRIPCTTTVHKLSAEMPELRDSRWMAMELLRRHVNKKAA